MKKKIILWGTGKTASIFEQFIDYKKVVLMAYVDNNKELWGKVRRVKKNDIKDILVIEPKVLNEYMSEIGESIVIVCSAYYEDIRKQLKELEINDGLVIDGFHIVNYKYDVRLNDILLPNYFEDTNNFFIDGFKTQLNSEHIPKYRKSCLMYDTIFPYLALLEENIMCKAGYRNHWIIDIGANVGDSVLGMIRNTTSNILAVEPTESFYTLMLENFEKLDKDYINRIKTVQAYISDNENEKFQSLVINGTAVKKLCETSEVMSLSIKTLLRIYNIECESVGLIKIDTDGFDADCIMSCGDLLKENAPLLYWENQIETNEQYNKYIKLCGYLKENNYNSYFVFDNFGNYIGCVDYEGLLNINGYLARINSYWGVRTFFYVDVLACKEYQKEKVQEIVGMYLNDYPVSRYIERSDMNE